MGPQFADDPDASWQYPGAQKPERPGPREDDATGSWKRLGPDPVPCHRNAAGSWPARAGNAVFSLVGFVCAAITLVSCIWMLGPIGIVLGVIGHIRGERLGKWAALASAVATGIALLIVFELAPHH